MCPSLFVAAYDTCQTALFWTLVMLSQHPRIARDVADELAKPRGHGATGIDKARNLPLLDAVVKESMRLFPPVPLQVRRAMRDTEIGGYPVPEKTRVVLSAFVTNRMPDIYPEPDRFIPGRWDTIKPTGYEYAVFSGGPRICPGQWFGMSALKVSLATILTRYRVALEPNVRIDYGIQPTLSPRAGVPAVLKSKQDVFTSAPIREGESPGWSNFRNEEAVKPEMARNKQVFTLSRYRQNGCRVHCWRSSGTAVEKIMGFQEFNENLRRAA